MSDPLIRWKGWQLVSGKRTAGTGASVMTPEQLAKHLFDARYQTATITYTAEGETREVGGVGIVEGRRTWWGETAVEAVAP